ncbi:RHS repeat-associated core domain-containing protein, partial [Zooshikella ganghwensis]|uniref:RHS repeat-associated core domain-containing protein n=1 Tax=Zooshikella ganghwensis TaxID=202772 RepID=UPI0023EAAC64
GRLMSQTVTGVQDLDYTYDPVGNITQINDSNNASYSATYQYDALDRLAQEQGYFGTKKYSFDPVGNRTKREWVTPNTAAEGQPSNSETHTQTLTYKKDSNRLTKVNNQTITTDATGHITENNPLSFTYDARGRIHSISKNGQLQAEYIYNVLGERVLKTRYKGDNKEYSTFHYNTNGQLLVDTLHDQNRKRLSRHYIWLDNMPLAMIEEVYQSNGKIDRHQVNYIHADHLNAPRRASDTKGNTSWAWYRDAYGEGNVNQDVDGDGKKTFIALRFPGQYYDPESGLFYNYQRYYDSSVGRYTTTDPIGLQGGLNTFAYVEGNPVNRVDPFGEVAIAIPVVIVGQLIVDAVAVSIGVYALTNDTPVSSEMAGLQRTRNTVSHAREAEILQG